MRKIRKLRMALAVCLTLAVAVLVSGFQAAEARPQYRTQFLKQYEEVKKNNPSGNLTCLVCHDKKAGGDSYDTKKHNNYGTAIKDVIEMNEKKADKIQQALKDVEPKDSAIKGKTFGDLLKEGKLPASKE
ncbi:MAG TPA: hypothetical protein VML55_16005 [Planctomycetaceae bacterium]|nr:hypothetical protein [Planctomycetaceae bacterium]